MLPVDLRVLAAPISDIPPALVLSVLLPVAAAVLLVVTLVVRRATAGPQRRPRVTVRRIEDREIFSLVARLESDNRQLQRLLNVLPEFTRQLAGDLDRRNLAPRLLNLLDYLFAPARSALFLEGAHEDALVPAAWNGLAAPLRRATPIRPGDGRIGWVAQHRVAMTGAELDARGVPPSGTDPALRSLERELDLCVPMVNDGALRGVIALSDVSRTVFDAKPIVRMIADLGAIALDNATLLRQTELAANQDPLTGLFNRRYMQAALDAELERSRASGEPLSVFFFDVDHFKSYNDINGHQAGDEALATIGRLMVRALREGDVPARYGGEEFVVILPGADPAGAMDAARKVRRAILEHRFRFGSLQPAGRVTISGGLASWPANGATADELLRAADAALYRAKRAGRDRLRAASPSGGPSARLDAAGA